MNKPTAQALAVASIVFLFAMVLSSRAPGGQYVGVIHNSVGNSAVIRGAGLSGVMDFRLVPTDWDRPKQPIRWLHLWPHLPAVSEVQITVARERLADRLATKEVIAEKKRRELQLQLDWEAGKKAVALTLMCLGAAVLLVAGWPPHRNSRNRV